MDILCAYSYGIVFVFQKKIKWEHATFSVVDTTSLPLDWGHGFDPRLRASIIIDDDSN